jgi:hypothetical protein
MTETKPKRRWFRFSLRTLFVLMTIICVWFGYSFNWIGQRHDYLKSHPNVHVALLPNEPLVAAPAMLWLLGEESQTRLQVESPGFAADPFLQVTPTPEAAELRSLFPEAWIDVTARDTITHTWVPGRDWNWLQQNEKGWGRIRDD